MTLMTRRLGLAALAAGLAAACTPARLFNAITPEDPARVLATGERYGEAGRQQLDVYGPQGGAPADGAPVAVFLYGGAWNSGSRGEYVWAGKALASQGFVAVVPDYRLTPEVAFPAFVEDGALAIRWIVDNIGRLGGDPSRIVLIGHSAGAYNAAMIALDPRYLQAAGVEPGRIKAFAGLAGPYYFPNLDGPILKAAFGTVPGEAYQAVRFASASSPPAFLAHGGGDRTVTPRNTEGLAKALREKGVEVEAHVYPGLSHADVLLAMSRTFRARRPLWDDMIPFLRRQAGLSSAAR